MLPFQDGQAGSAGWQQPDQQPQYAGSASWQQHHPQAQHAADGWDAPQGATWRSAPGLYPGPPAQPVYAAPISGLAAAGAKPQRMVLLAGLPGSGKTTLAKRLQEQGWFWVNQDTMGNRKTCKKACIRALRDGLDVVIDRCNFDPEQRGVWVRLAAEMGDGPQGIFVHTIALHLDIAIGECIQRVVSRSNHPTLNGEEAIVTIRRFAADFRKLSRREGFGEIFRATNQHEIDNFAKYVGAANVPASAFGDSKSGSRAAQSVTAGSSSWQPGIDLTNSEGRPDAPGPSSNYDQQHWQHPHMQHGQEPGSALPEAPSSNALPFPSKRLRLAARGQGGQAGRHLSSNGGAQAGPQTFIDEALPADSRPFLLFDLNGTLTSHTSARRSAGENRMRPGLHHLRRLAAHFQLGIFSSASQRTVKTVLPMLEAAAGAGPELFSQAALVLTRQNTIDAPAHHIASGGKPWDTVKPLHRYFQALHRVVLVDDDAFKAVAGEESNMVKIPCWDGSDSDDVIHLLVDTLLDVLGPLPADGDVRLHTEQISKALLAGSYEQQQEGGAEPNPEEINLPDDDQVEEAEAAGLPGGGGIALAVAA